MLCLVHFSPIFSNFRPFAALCPALLWVPFVPIPSIPSANAVPNAVLCPFFPHHSHLFLHPSGALLSFRQSSLNFTLSLSILDAFIRREKAQWMPETLGISLVRVDKDDFHPLYQVPFSS